MGMWLEALKLGAAGIGGGGLSALAGLAAQRKQYHLDILDQVNESVTLITRGLRSEIDRLNGEVTKLRTAHTACEDRCTKLEAEVHRLLSQAIPDYTELRRLENGRMVSGFEKREQPQRSSPGPDKGDPPRSGED